MYDVYIDRVDVHVCSPPGATPAGRGAAGILDGGVLLLLLLLPPVHTGPPVLGQQGPTVHGVSTLGESRMCRDWDQSAD